MPTQHVRILGPEARRLLYRPIKGSSTICRFRPGTILRILNKEVRDHVPWFRVVTAAGIEGFILQSEVVEVGYVRQEKHSNT